MSPSVTADSIVNLCGAIGLGVAMVALYRRDSRSPLTRRLLAMLGVVAVLFLTRGVAWWSDSVWLDRLSLIPAALVPLGALLVTEGMLRRHAPPIIKLLAVIGAIVFGFGGAAGLEQLSVTTYAILLSLFQVAGFASCAWLMATRDRGALLASENRGIGRLAVGALVLIPFVVTDFRALLPDFPVRLGALGALLVVTAVLIAGGGTETRRQASLMTLLRLSSSALLGIAAACVAPDVDAAQIVRFSAIAIAGVLTIGLMTDTLRAFFESQVPGVLNAVAASPARTRDQLIAELSSHPIFESARRFREPDLAGLRSPAAARFPVDAASAAACGGAMGRRHIRSGGRAPRLAHGCQQRHACDRAVARSRRSHSARGPRHISRSGHRDRARAAATPVGLDARGGVTNKAAGLIWRVRNRCRSNRCARRPNG